MKRVSLISNMNFCGKPFSLLILAALLLSAVRVVALEARTQLSTSKAFVGEPVTLQISVDGVAKITPPKFPSLGDFRVRFLGASPHTSSSMTIINGRMSQTKEEKVILTYELIPQRVGLLQIPSLTLSHNGESCRSTALQLRVVEPQDSAHVKLRIVPERASVYVGEPLRLRWTLYFDANLQGLNMSNPILKMKEFEIPVVAQNVPASDRRQYVSLNLGDGRKTIARQAQGQLDGQRYTTLSFEKILIPRSAGNFDLPKSTAVCGVVTGRRRSRDPFNPFNPYQDVIKRVAVPSNSVKLLVKEVPSEGRPPNFSGNVGDFTLTARANPTDVNVGDPIDLTLTISGPDFLEPVECPPLGEQENLTRDFRLSQDKEPGEIQGRSKIFRRILRAENPDVEEIPPIELVYFDSKKGSYAVARSKAIPLTVKATKVVTALDAEGNAPTSRAKTALKSWSKGIASNYEDSGALKNQRAGLDVWLSSPLWLSLLFGPPALYFLLFVLHGYHQRRHTDPRAFRARRAGSLCLRALRNADAAEDLHAEVLGILQSYFGDKLGVAGGALTFADLRPQLSEAGIPEDVIDTLQSVFHACEAGRYAGGASLSDDKLTATSIQAVQTIEKILR